MGRRKGACVLLLAVTFGFVVTFHSASAESTTVCTTTQAVTAAPTTQAVTAAPTTQAGTAAPTTPPACPLTCSNGGTKNEAACTCTCAQSWSGTTCSVCSLSASSCLNGGIFESTNCECVCPLTHSGTTCQDASPCLTNSNLCSQTGQQCLPASSAPFYQCQCKTFDGYLQNADGSCAARSTSTLRFSIAIIEIFVPALRNQWSAAFQAKAAILEKLLLAHFKISLGTENVIAVIVLSFSSGSTVADVTSFYPNNAVPTQATVMSVLSKTANLSDANTIFILNATAASVTGTNSECTAGYCNNRGTCSRSGTVPPFTYTCSCQAGFAGATCDAVIPVGGGELSTLAITLIIVGCAVLVLVILAMVVFFCILMRRQYGKGLGQWPNEPRRNHAFDKYEDRSQDSSDRNEDTRRMARLMQVMSQSPYLQQGLPHQQEFIRPYLVTGNEEYQRPNRKSDNGQRSGVVARNPLASMY